MQIKQNMILITGGSSGIGLALAEALIKAGNNVIICGRSERKLNEAHQNIPELNIYVCDVSERSQRESLFKEISSKFPEINILINNAGIQKETDFLSGAPNLYDGESEIDTNFTSVVQLSALFIPYFIKTNKECAIVNITSGLAFIPLKIVPVYCATKAALHSFSMTLRSQLVDTNIKVFEIIPPIVKTALHRGVQAKKQAERGISPERVANSTLKALKKDKYEKSVGQGGDLKVASRLAPHFFHRLLNKLVSKE
jgi:uncharacterized oxidoreductase